MHIFFLTITDDINWNALEWDRAAEALTWEELLGLDGSLVFLEHVYWVTVLNALFIFLFGEYLGVKVQRSKLLMSVGHTACSG